MAKTPVRHNQRWTPDEVRQLRKLARANMPTRVIATKLGRTPASVVTKASDEGVSLRPTNRSPHGRRKTP